MQQLIYHDWTELPSESPEIPRRSKGKYWRGIAHQTLMKTVSQECKKLGIQMRNSTIVLSPNKHKIQCVIELDFGKNFFQGHILGIVNSNLGDKALSFYMGLYSEGTNIFLFQIGKPKKHTSGFSLKKALSITMDEYKQIAWLRHMESLIEHYKTSTISKEEKHNLLVDAMQRHIITNRAASHLLSRKEEERNVWELMLSVARAGNQFTPGGKLLSRMDQMVDFKTMVDDFLTIREEENK